MNPHRGEVEFGIGSQACKLRFGTNALCEIEAATGKALNDVLKEVQGKNPRLGLLRTIFAAGLTIDGRKASEEEAGDAIDALGIEGTASTIGQAFALAFPPTSGKAGGNGRASGSTGRN